MTYEVLFSGVGILAICGWLTLLISPWVPVWSDRIAGYGIPIGLSVIYLLIVTLLPTETGNFDSFAGIVELFSEPQALMAGWIHFLAFDLFVGAWICRKARQQSISFWLVLPCLPITFLFGPAGLLVFLAILGVRYARTASSTHSAA